MGISDVEYRRRNPFRKVGIGNELRKKSDLVIIVGLDSQENFVLKKFYGQFTYVIH